MLNKILFTLMLRDESFNIRSGAGYICGGWGRTFWPSTLGGRKQIILGAGVGGGGYIFLYFYGIRGIKFS